MSHVPNYINITLRAIFIVTSIEDLYMITTS
jgi:hypothetical protein